MVYNISYEIRVYHLTNLSVREKCVLFFGNEKCFYLSEHLTTFDSSSSLTQIF